MAAARLRQLFPMLRQCSANKQPFSSQFSTQPNAIQVTPKVSLFDQKVHIKVQGLPSNAKVTFQACTQQEWRREAVEFVSCGHFVTNDAGDLDLTRDVSLGGTYTGADSMGLFWSLVPSPAGPQNIRMVVRNGDEPILFSLSIYSGHLSLSDLVSTETKPKPLHTTTIERWKKSADVRRIPVREGNVRGTLFLPPGDGPFPGVIDMFGSAGGLMETRACLLASHGFAALALPFFRYEDLPPSLEEVTFDYFEEAAEWLSSHPLVKKTGIGTCAVSTGAQFSLLMAWKCPQVKAVVFINGPTFFWLYNLYRKDKKTLVRKGTPMEMGFAEPKEHGLAIRHCFPHSLEDIIPVWESSANLLVLVSEDDQQVDPEVAQELFDSYPPDKRHQIEVVRYAGAGHLLEPPFNPHCKGCINPTFGMDFLWGGNPKDHATAQWDSWQRILSFFNKNLS